jgi:hypothetical protein
MRFRRVIGQPGHTVSPVAADPRGHGGAGDLQASGHPGPRPPVLDGKLDEFAAPSRGQRRVGMGRAREKSLRGIRLSVVNQSIPEALTF